VPHIYDLEHDWKCRGDNNRGKKKHVEEKGDEGGA